MNYKIMIYSLSLFILTIINIEGVMAQKERKDIRSGNESYDKGNYSGAEVDYKRATVENPQSFPAYFNMAGSIYKQEGRMAEAEKLYMSLKDSDAASGYVHEDEKIKAKLMYNLGNAQLSQRKIDEAIESYKSSLRIDPTDRDAKFNLAYAQKLKQDQQNQDNQQNQDDQKNQNDDQQNQKDNQQDNKDQSSDKDQGNQDQNDQNQSDDQNKSSESDPQNSAGKQENERMLKAIQAAEDKTQRQLNQRRQKQEEEQGKNSGVGVVGGVRNW